MASFPEITVNICMITYNHEAYIKQAIEGVLMQKTSFPIKLIIGEDNSPDATRDICEEYAAKHPDLIEILPTQKDNLGMSRNFIRTLAACKGDYISFCEGDDYWTYDKKLEEQVSFLEKNRSFNLCSHIYKKKTGKNTYYIDNYNNLVLPHSEGISFTLEDHFKHWLTKTLTVTIRNNINLYKELRKYKYARDSHLIYHTLKNSKGFCFSFVGGVYRLHNGGVHSTLSDFQKAKEGLKIFIELRKNNKKDKILESKYHDIIKHYLNNLALKFILSLKDKQYSKTAFRIDKEFLPIIILHLPYLLLITGKILLNLNRTSITKTT